MKTMAIVLLACFQWMHAGAQVTKVSLQASGLTCSMCSKAVLNALKKAPDVKNVTVNIKNQEYQVEFTNPSDADFDALVKAVDDAGFSVAGFRVTAMLSPVTIQKDEHIRIGGQTFHFLNATGQQLDGTVTFSVVDKSFTSAKNFKKYSQLSTMECVQTGRSAACCAKDGIPEQARIYHAII